MDQTQGPRIAPSESNIKETLKSSTLVGQEKNLDPSPKSWKINKKMKSH